MSQFNLFGTGTAEACESPAAPRFPLPPLLDSDAEFSADLTYRYRLWRVWDRSLPRLNFLMLNPSTADAKKNDPTVERCMRRAIDWGFGGLEVTNLFAFRATDPKEMKAAFEPVGSRNDAVIVQAAKAAGQVVCAWGTDGRFMGRAAHVRKLLADAGVQAYALKVTTGEPWHPLYLSYDLKPFPLT